MIQFIGCDERDNTLDQTCKELEMIETIVLSSICVMFSRKQESK